VLGGDCRNRPSSHVGRFAASLIKPRPLIHINASDLDGTVWWMSRKGGQAATSALNQKGGRNGFLACSSDCHSCSDRDHGRCIRALSRLFVNGSTRQLPESRPTAGWSLFARSRLRLAGSSLSRDGRVTSPDDEYPASPEDVPLTARRVGYDRPISGSCARIVGAGAAATGRHRR
jgi:hypothetical protein